MNKHVVVLVNLGSPRELTKSAIRNFLACFLTDRRVVNLSKIIWYPILYGIILPFRVSGLLKKYRLICLQNGQLPLVHYTIEQAAKLSQLARDDTLIIKYAFSYVSPSLAEVLTDIHAHINDIKKLSIIPLYPQFSSTTTLPIFDALAKFYSRMYYMPHINFISDFHDNTLYIEAIAASIRSSWSDYGRGEKLIFSYHSLPQNIIESGDRYYAQCVATTKLVAQSLALNADDYCITFQSKFGRSKWLTPATTATLKELANTGVKDVDVVCPGFFSDCLETLEEIALMNKDVFLDAGGRKYTYISCLNDNDVAINLLRSLLCVE